MKHKILPLFLLLSFYITAKANETEPNNTKQQANTFALNRSNSGKIVDSSDVDWWKLTTTGDGNIAVTITVSNGWSVDCILYDSTGTNKIANGSTSDSITISANGFAAGTYYLKMGASYSNKPVYTISNVLTQPAEANDAEPNNTKDQAIKLPLNKSKQGHVWYRYVNNADIADWYKLTTNADGDLRIIVQSGDNVPKSAYAILYDNDGTTQLAYGNYSGNSYIINKNGLAPGTYYIMISAFGGLYTAYTLSDSLFKAVFPGDSEPNDSKANAITLPLKRSKTGHIGYYYQNKADSADWYKLTTTADGMVTVNLQSGNAENITAYLYDNDGTTLLTSANTSDSTSFSFDGLKPGTYYIKISSTSSDNAAFYKLSYTFSGYSFADDGNSEPNDDFSTAKTIPSNTNSITGHAGFYYNGTLDLYDYFKINYTGTGNLTLTFSQENRLNYGSPAETWCLVYRDLDSGPIAGGVFNSSTADITLEGLTEGYYYIQVFPGLISPGESFSSYRIKNAFTQKDKAKIAITSTQASPDCTPLNSITFKLSKSHAPYKVSLYRFGSLYSTVDVSGNTAAFSNLPSGSYYATVYGDGATGKAYSTSTVTTFAPPVPTGLTTTAIKAAQATLKWTALTCADYFSIQYHVKGAATWTTVNATGNVTSYILKGLLAATNYEWKVAAVDSGNGVVLTGDYSVISSFKTKGSALSADDDNEENISIAGSTLNGVSLAIAPNPAASYFIIKYNAPVKDKVTATLYAMNGKAVWTSGAVNADALNNRKINVSGYAGGAYYLKITDSKGIDIGNIKVSVSK